MTSFKTITIITTTTIVLVFLHTATALLGS